MKTDRVNSEITPTEGHLRQDTRTQADGNVADASLFSLSLNKNTLNGLSKASDKAIDAKVVRRVYVMFPGIGGNELNSLGILEMYLYIADRVNVGVSMDEVVNWSGARRSWTRKVEKGFIDLLKLGCIEQIKVHQGHRIDITTKGRQVLKYYDQKFEEIRQENEERRKRAKPAKRFLDKTKYLIEPGTQPLTLRKSHTSRQATA